MGWNKNINDGWDGTFETCPECGEIPAGRKKVDGKWIWYCTKCYTVEREVRESGSKPYNPLDTHTKPTKLSPSKSKK